LNRLEEVKKLVNNCTFLAFETVKDKLFFKAVIKNGKNTDRIRVQINCKLEDVGLKEYDDLLNILINKSYDNTQTV
jgi:hypothetical protein